MRKINYIVLHCTGGPSTQKLADIQAYWKQKGWRKPGYHHIIDTAGIVTDLLPIEQISNGVKGHNSDSINISYIGGINSKGEIFDSRTEAQKQAMKRLVLRYKERFPDARILGHRDFSPDKNRNGIIDPAEWMKACPSFSVTQWLKEEKII